MLRSGWWPPLPLRMVPRSSGRVVAATGRVQVPSSNFLDIKVAQIKEDEAGGEEDLRYQ